VITKSVPVVVLLTGVVFISLFGTVVKEATGLIFEGGGGQSNRRGLGCWEGWLGGKKGAGEGGGGSVS
jgi:hypothetical protein